MSARPFKVLGIQQIAIGGPDKNRLKTLWVDKLGLEVTGTFRSERENVESSEVTAARQVLEGEVLELHARYLPRRSALHEACASILRAASPESRTAPVAALAGALAVSGVLYTRRRLAQTDEPGG